MENSLTTYTTGLADFKSIRTCPKCESRLSPGTTECANCGVLVSRVLAQIEDPFQADFRIHIGQEIVDAWQLVVQNYETEEAHWSFLQECQRQGALEFAAFRYRRMVEVLNDDIAAKMLKRVTALSLLEFEEAFVHRPVRPVELKFKLRAVYLVALFLCAFSLVMARAGEVFRALSLLGAIFLTALIVGRLLFRRAHELRIPKEQEIYDWIDVATGGTPVEKIR